MTFGEWGTAPGKRLAYVHITVGGRHYRMVQVVLSHVVEVLLLHHEVTAR
jgi:hypothetical protein